MDDPEIVRLIVDDECWDWSWSNAAYVSRGLSQVRAFVRTKYPSARLIVAPAGMLTFELDAQFHSVSGQSLADVLAACASLAPQLAAIRLGEGPRLLLGIDGAVGGNSTPLQTVVSVDGSRIEFDSAGRVGLKVYPTTEERNLWGWRLWMDGAVGERDLNGRAFKAGGSSVFPLVCHESVSFSKRSRENRKNSYKRGVARALAKSIVGKRYVTASIHWIKNSKSAAIFRTATRNIAKENGATVIPSTFAPRRYLRQVAAELPIVDTSGANAAPVATLLVTA
jgi:hypothetical protein